MNAKGGFYFHHVHRSPHNWMIEHLMDAPVIENGIFEDDFYKFSMGQFIYNNPEYREAQVTFEFTNRTKSFRPQDYMTLEDIHREFEHFRNTAALSKSNRHYLDGTYEYGERMFTPEYLTSLQKIRIPELNISVADDGQFDMKAKGKWIEASHAETPMMKIVKTLYTRSLIGKMSPSERHAFLSSGVTEAYEFIKVMKENPGITMADFANRRAAFSAWLWFLDNLMVEEFGTEGQFKGTSRTDFAKELDVMPVGTNAHELWMVIAALYFDGTRESLAIICNKIVREWMDLYGAGLAVLLPDTFTTEFLFEVLSDGLFEMVSGGRPDSGDMHVQTKMFCEKFISVGQDPKEKLMVYSDGVTRKTMLEFHLAFREWVRDTYGVGTGWGSNIPGVPGLIPALDSPSIVSKAMEVNGVRTCKISDNVAKAMGNKKPYLEAIGVEVGFNEQPVS